MKTIKFDYITSHKSMQNGAKLVNMVDLRKRNGLEEGKKNL